MRRSWTIARLARSVPCALLVLGGAVALPAAAQAAAAAPVTRSQVVAAATTEARGYHVGVAVLDRRTGQLYTSGDARGTFATESVVKVLIATRLLVEKKMTGATARTAYKMITQSDDGSANALYGRVGGDGLMAWTKKYFLQSNLGSGPIRRNWWGGTRITPVGLVQLYQKLAANSRVAPWLLNAMHHATRNGSDGTYQFFGLPSATTNAAVKQGWGCEYTPRCADADFNSTGFVNGDRYAVALLARGPRSTYGARISSALTTMARRILPHGSFPPPAPTLTGLSKNRSPLSGGATVTVSGRDFVGVRSVTVGGTPARVVSATTTSLRIALPAHRAGGAPIVVQTPYGTSAVTSRAALTYFPSPVVRTISTASTAARGGERITLTGTTFVDVDGVDVGGQPASWISVSSAGTLTFTAPAHAEGPAPVTVRTDYGRSNAVGLTAIGPPTVSDLSPATVPTDASTVTLTGSQFVGVRSVTFDGVPGTDVSVTSSTSLRVVAPAHAPGPVAVVVTTAYGNSSAVTLTVAAPGGS